MQIGVDSQRAVENKRVFVVDEDEVNSMGLQFMLADENETHVLPRLEAALEKAVRWQPDLVLLGAGQLATDPVGVIARIKAGMNNVKVVIVCAKLDEPGVREALANGANGTLYTPLTIEGVRRRVDTALGRVAALGIPVVPV